MNKFFNVFQKIKPQSRAHVFGNNPHLQEDIKPDSPMESKHRSPSQYQDEYNMTYLEKEDLKQLPEATSWQKSSFVGEYDNMELIHYTDVLFIDVPSIPDYWITAKRNTALNVNDSIWYTEMEEIHGRRKWPWWKRQIIQKYRNVNWIWKKTMSF
ncbi:hypothetical protein O181_007157 [Austropuccinia psidii MF-1]|uniref:Uncharacterized protein n=1 Tax=Austropuccinia psidii MF-1 TaxID=1389203 RepID=A0A9Q3GI76_9BASI|nr:hypothetical protein [Austropuccinia psidii MF-1]